MPNVLDAKPLRAFALRAAARIANPSARVRFEELAIAALFADARNFRPASEADLRDAPDWTMRAIERGETISVFKLNRSACLRLHAIARNVRDACELAEMSVAIAPSLAGPIAAAREFISKIHRANFVVVRAKAAQFARAYAMRGRPEDEAPACEPGMIVSTRDRVWTRITSLAQLRALGCEFVNCLRHTGRNSRYGGGLVRGLAQFWVLREGDGVGVLVAMATTTDTPCFIEVAGPHNVRVSLAHPDLLRLGRALGMRPSNPPPPAPAGAATRPPRNLTTCVCARCTQQMRATLLHGVVVAS